MYLLHILAELNFLLLFFKFFLAIMYYETDGIVDISIKW